MNRNAFAAAIGVTPLTVYRWELPEDAAEARRPRGKMLAKIASFEERLGAGEIDNTQPDGVPKTDPQPSSAPAKPSTGATPHGIAQSAGSVATLPPPTLDAAVESSVAGSPSVSLDSQLQSAHISPKLQASPALEEALSLVQRCRWQEAETKLFEMLTAASGLQPDQQALAHIGMAKIQLLGRGNSRGAVTSLLPALGLVDEGGVTTDVGCAVHALAALIFSFPDGRLFDPGRAALHIKKARRRGRDRNFAGMSGYLIVAELMNALHTGDNDLFLSILERSGTVDPEAIRHPLQRNLAREALAISSLMRGRVHEAERRLQRIADETAKLGFHLAQARALARLALIKLESSERPAKVRTLKDKARQVGNEGELAPGEHTLLIGAIRAELALRSGDIPKAGNIIEETMATGERLKWPPVALGFAISRWGFFAEAGNFDAMAKRFRAWEGTPMGEIAMRVAGYLDGLEAHGSGDHAAAIAKLRQVAEWAEETHTMPWLNNYSHLFAFGAAVASGDNREAQALLRQAERAMEAAPSVWFSGFLKFYTCMQSLNLGEAIAAERELDEAIAAFDLADDALGKMMLGYFRKALQGALGDPAMAKEAEANAEAIREAGIRIPPHIAPPTITAPSNRERPCDEEGQQSLSGIIGSLQRLVVRGMTQEMLTVELTQVCRDRFPETPVRLEEVDSVGRRSVVPGGEERLSMPKAGIHESEFSDGCGRRFRLLIGKELGRREGEVVRALVTVASQSMEIAALRYLASAGAGDSEQPQTLPQLPNMVAASSEMRAIAHELGRLGRSRSTILIQGESGVGKEVVARAAHDLSGRAKKPYVAFNCAAVPGELFEGQLFGYRKGAFTGANTSQPGVIRAANGGTLFLDEIGDLPLALQPKLLRFLENGEVFPLGDTKPSRVDVRVITASHRDLEALVQEKKFREDLFYRLNVIPIEIPPLRERREDILALAKVFIQRHTPEGQTPPPITPEAAEAMFAFPWPGNVRELRNRVERAMAFSPTPQSITPEVLGFS